MFEISDICGRVLPVLVLPAYNTSATLTFVMDKCWHFSSWTGSNCLAKHTTGTCKIHCSVLSTVAVFCRYQCFHPHRSSWEWNSSSNWYMICINSIFLFNSLDDQWSYVHAGRSWESSVSSVSRLLDWNSCVQDFRISVGSVLVCLSAKAESGSLHSCLVTSTLYVQQWMNIKISIMWQLPRATL